jgi:hypothetical protein
MNSSNTGHRALLAFSIFYFLVIPTVQSQNVGVNTTTPTRTLDVNGYVRIRGGSPAYGKVLAATDANGNTGWMDVSDILPTVAFAASGAATGGAANIPGNGTYYRVPFSNTEYNWGASYTGLTNVAGYNLFKAPATGIYHFDAQVSWSYNTGGYDGVSAILVRIRNGARTILRTSYQNFSGQYSAFSQVSCDVLLQENDQVCIEANHQSGGSRVMENSNSTFFNGRLVLKQ